MMQANSISFIEKIKQISGVVTLVIHYTQDKRGISSIFLLKVAHEKIIVKAEFGTINSVPQIGQIWQATGDYVFNKEYGSQFMAEVAEKVLPNINVSTDILCDFLIYNANFVGFNNYWVKKLKSVFGIRLFEVLQNYSPKDFSSDKKLKLSSVMAQNLCDGWAKCSAENELNCFFEEYDLPIEYIESTRLLLGANACSLLRLNPYLLYPIVSVRAAIKTWKTLDKTIRSNFKIKLDDKRRAISFIESILYSAFNNNGDMALPANEIKVALTEAGFEFELNELGKCIFQTLVFNKENHTVQILGHQSIEKTINALLIKRSSEIKPLFDIGSLAFDAILSIPNLNAIELNSFQLKAINNAFTLPVSFVAGQAGTGKSLLSQVIIEVCRNNGITVWRIDSVANKGNDLANLKEEPINRFLSQAKKRNLKGNLSKSLILVESANSIDSLVLYKLLKVIPLHAHICFIGDKYNLPPLGPGSFFKQAFKLESDIVTELLEVNDGKSNYEIQKLSCSLINNTASSVFDLIPVFDASGEQTLSIYHTDDKSHRMLCSMAVNIWLEVTSILSDVPQIVCSTSSLCDDINTHIQMVRFDRKKITKVEVGDSTFHAGEPIIFAKSNKSINAEIGTLATIVKIYEQPVFAYGREYIMSIDLNGKFVDLSLEDIDSIALSYAITAYKVKSYQFSHTLVILDNLYLINKSWLYTYVNASIDSILFVGDKVELVNKVSATDFSVKRHHGIALSLDISNE